MNTIEKPKPTIPILPLCSPSELNVCPELATLSLLEAAVRMTTAVLVDTYPHLQPEDPDDPERALHEDSVCERNASSLIAHSILTHSIALRAAIDSYRSTVFRDLFSCPGRPAPTEIPF